MSSLPSHIRRIYQPLCALYAPEQATELRRQVLGYARTLQTPSLANEFIDLSAVRQAEQILATLLENYDRLSEAQRPWLVGAARYFIEEDDADHDVNSFLGIDDDIMVINYMLAQIGRIDLKITL